MSPERAPASALAVSSHSVLRGEERPMYLHRPTSSRSQDVAHLLAATFRELFTRESVPADTVSYLHQARGGADEYHEQYVAALQQVQGERDRRMSETAMLERHIMQAQARAMSADERLIRHQSAESSQSFPDLGLPPARSHFRCCIDSELMRKYNLITPEDFVADDKPFQAPPTTCSEPNYVLGTKSSTQRLASRREGGKGESPLPPIRRDSPEESCVSETEQSFNLLELNSRSAPVGRRRVWHQEPNAETRQENKRCLAQLESCVNYLRNPRHAPPQPDSGGATLLLPRTNRQKPVAIRTAFVGEARQKPSQIFLANPKEMIFTKYCVGQVYEMSLELKNVTSVLRPVRLIPPRTSFFTASLGIFPNEQGLVAAGMSCYYTIRFSPDSLCDFDDRVLIQTQADEALVITLRGRRPPPILTLSPQFEMGECLAGGLKIGHFVVVNEGGSGRFCLLATASWPAANFKTVVSVSQVRLPPFEVRPSMFQLLEGQSTVIEVLFSPSQLKSYSQDISIICDNCQVKHCQITGSGTLVHVAVSGGDGCFTERDPVGMYDVTAHRLLDFGPLNPFSFAQKLFVVTNSIDVDLVYHWVVVKPHILPRFKDANDDLTLIPVEREPENQPLFIIEPAEGVLQGNASVEFCVTFAPSKVGRSHDVLHMILRNIPINNCNGDAGGAVGSVSERSSVGEFPGSDVAPKKHQSCSGLSGVVAEDLTAVEVEVIGDCEPFSVCLQPYAIIIPAEILIQTSIKKHLLIINTSISNIVFQWEKVFENGYVIEVEPHIAELGALCEMHLELSISGSRPGRVNHLLLCHIQHVDEPLTLHVQADILGPEIVVDDPDLNFGLVELGDEETMSLRIRNTSRMSAKWAISESEEHAVHSVTDRSDFTFERSEGELQPLEESEIVIVFRPTRSQSLRTVFEFVVENGNKCFVSVRAEVQSARVCLLNCELTFSDIYASVPVSHQVALLNQTLLPTTFKWGELSLIRPTLSETDDESQLPPFSEYDLRNYLVTFDPASGVIGAREKLNVTVNFSTKTTGRLPELRVACYIGSMDKPLSLALFGEVRGPDVLFRCVEQEDEEDEGWMDLGDHLPLGATPSHQLYITNKTAIPTRYSLHFAELPATDAGLPPPATVQTPSKCRLLGHTPNLADPLSKSAERTQKDRCQSILKGGYGAAFTVAPSGGVLQPFEKLQAIVRGFNDMWGVYQDTLVCQLLAVKEEMTTDIDVLMSVDGCPLYFQMMTSEPQGQAPVLRLGTLTCGADPVSRQMKINNCSSVDIRLDWETLNRDRKLECKLLDLIVTYGDLFPLKDEQGNEVMPQGADIPLITRQATDFIPNTPDTTPATSRQLTQMEVEMTGSEERPKVVTVNLMKRVGERSSDPFTISPSQLMIPAHGFNYMHVTFTPPTIVESTTDFNGMAHGYMSLDGKEHQLEGMVERLHKYDMAPMKLNMAAICKPPKLTIECADDDLMHFDTAASDLIQDGQLTTEVIKHRRCVISNRTEMPLGFHIGSSEPFPLVVAMRTSGVDRRQHALYQLRTEELTLEPRENIMVTVAFRLTLDLIKDRFEEDPGSDGKMPGSPGDLVPETTATQEAGEGVGEGAGEGEGGERRKEEEDIEDAEEHTLPFTYLAAEVAKPDEGIGEETLAVMGDEEKPTDGTELPDGEVREVSGTESRGEAATDDTDGDRCPRSIGVVCQLREDLTITFVNGSTQTLPLTATVVLPSFTLSRQHVDFGTCLVGQRLTCQLMLTNGTRSACLWTLLPDRLSTSCADDTFSVSPDSGRLDADISYVSHNKVLLTVAFTARHTDIYEAEFVIRGVFAEEPVCIRCTGQGSYDGRHETLLDS